MRGVKRNFKTADTEIEKDDRNMETTDDFENVLYNVNRCKNSVNIVCRVCKKKAGGAHRCYKSKCVVHLIISKWQTQVLFISTSVSILIIKRKKKLILLLYPKPPAANAAENLVPFIFSMPLA